MFLVVLDEADPGRTPGDRPSSGLRLRCTEHPPRANIALFGVSARDDLLAAQAIFAIVVLSTFPVVLPFAFIENVGTATTASRVIAVAMLFFGGLALGRYAGYGSLKAELMMVGLGAGLVVAVIALGG